MARALRLEYPGAVHHVTCRGNEQQAVFKDDNDRQRFLQMLVQSIGIYGVKLYSFVLMSNHFHLLLETPRGNLSEFMRHFNITYTGHFNRQHKRVGHLYQGRFKSILVDKDSYLSILSRYIHLNPVRVKSMEKTSSEEKMRYLFQYQWSSLPVFINEQKKKWYIDYNMVLEEYGGETDNARREYRNRITAEIGEGLEIEDKILGRSILGNDKFIECVTVKYLKGKEDRERPSIREIHRCRSKEAILKAITMETGKDIDDIKAEKGILRQLVMELLYRAGSMKGEAIGKMMNIGYTSVSQERRRLRERMAYDKGIVDLIRRIEDRCNK